LAKIVHIDVDPAEIGKNLRVDVPIVGDLKIVLKQLLDRLEPATRDEWLIEIARLKAIAPHARASETAENADAGTLSSIKVMEALDKALPKGAIITTDVGQHQIWAATRLIHREPRHFISSGGLGAMGYGIPAAIGAMIANPGAPVLCVSGDGSFQMGLPELGTAVEQGLPLKILLMNNSSLGLVRQLQDYYCDHRYTASMLTFNPDFGDLIKAYGGEYYLATDIKSLTDALPAFFAEDRLALLEARVQKEENALPMVLMGDALDSMIQE
jgi:acetolactate synthase-1/2/3 large subunit